MEKKKGIIEKIFKKKQSPKNTAQPSNFEIRRGIVKEIIVKSPLEEKFFLQAYRKMPEKTKTLPEGFLEKKFSFDRPVQEQPEKKKSESALTLVVIPSEEYTKNIHFLCGHLSEKYQKILYVSLNEIYSNLLKSFEAKKIDIAKFYFIDAITGTAQTYVEKKPNCTFVVSPNSLVELSLAISSALESEKPDVVFFDSISTLLIYENEKIVVKFIHSLIGKIRSAGSDALFTALEGDSKSQAIKDLGMFVDDFISIDKFRMYRVELGFSAQKTQDKEKKPIV